MDEDEKKQARDNIKKAEKAFIDAINSNLDDGADGAMIRANRIAVQNAETASMWAVRSVYCG